MRRFRTAAAFTLVLMVLTAPAMAQFPRLPDLGDVVGDVLKGKIPGLNKILTEEPAISTTFDDAVFGVPLLDDLSPFITAPMCQLPDTGDGAFIVAVPGMYELDARSYCLHAGTYGPGQGEGYLWAPLKGDLAGVIQDVLDRSMAHPELAQDKVQSLIWAIQSRAKINDMPTELRDVAQVLLDKKQIRRLNGGALGLIPDELMDQAFVDIPDEVRMVLEAEARLRDRLRQEVYDFDALEEVAVLAGDPAPTEGGAVIPDGRWSFEPGGFFVRFSPDGYPETKLQLYAPEPFRAIADEAGRITSLIDRRGNTIEAIYAATGPLVAQGDPNVAAHVLQSIRLIAAGGQVVDLSCLPGDAVLTGVPSGGGAFTGDLSALYAAGTSALSDVRELARNVDGASPDSPLVGNVLNLQQFANALGRLAEREGVANVDLSRWEAMGREAVASELMLLLEGRESDTAFRDPEERTRLAVLPWATGTVLDIGQASWGNPGGGFFRPSRGSGTPASRDRQRLGISGGSRQIPTYRPDTSPDEDDGDGPSGGDGKGAMNRARKAIDAIQKGKDVVDFVTNPVGTLAGKIGLGLPNALFGKILDFNFDAWGKASKALGGDPPVPDYDQIAMPEPVSLPSFTPAAGVSMEHTMAVEALSQALAENLAIVRAANITEDRLGGALAANDDEWVTLQAAQLIEYKRQAGQGMMQISDDLTAVLQALRNAGVNDITVTPAAVMAYQQRLQATGWDADELQAAQILGIGPAELQEMLAERIAADPSEVAGSVMESHDELAEALWWFGMSLSNLPPPSP